MRDPVLCRRARAGAAGVCAALALAGCQPESDATASPLRLDDADQRQSYALGYQLAGNLQERAVPLDAAALSAGVADRLSGAEPRLGESERLAALEAYQKRAQASRPDGQRADANRAASEKYLRENARRSEVAVTDSGLQYEVIESADGPVPGPQDRVRVHYRGQLVDGTEFDSSYRRGEPAVFRVDQVIAGWQEALRMMSAGSRWRLAIPAELAYGAGGPGPIGPDSALVFEVELLEVLR